MKFSDPQLLQISRQTEVAKYLGDSVRVIDAGDKAEISAAVMALTGSVRKYATEQTGI